MKSLSPFPSPYLLKDNPDISQQPPGFCRVHTPSAVLPVALFTSFLLAGAWVRVLPRAQCHPCGKTGVELHAFVSACLVLCAGPIGTSVTRPIHHEGLQNKYVLDPSFLHLLEYFYKEMLPIAFYLVLEYYSPYRKGKVSMVLTLLGRWALCCDPGSCLRCHPAQQTCNLHFS